VANASISGCLEFHEVGTFMDDGVVGDRRPEAAEDEWLLGLERDAVDER